MLLYVPVTRVDYHLAGPLFRLMEKLGGLGEHSMIVATTPEGIPDADKEHLLMCAHRLGDKVYPKTLAVVPELGWPRNPNYIFQEAAMDAASNRAYGEPCWYFFELDNCPTRPGWLDELQEEYTYRARPCMGVINTTYRTRSGGHQYPDGEHLVGAGIYPPDFFTVARVCRHLHLLPEPFDVALQSQTVPLTWNTKLIQHNWSTKDYQLQNQDRAVCESCSLRPTSKDYAKPVVLGDRGPLVVHGCKDVSLIRIIGKRYGSSGEAQEVVIPPKAVFEAAPEITITKRKRRREKIAV